MAVICTSPGGGVPSATGLLDQAGDHARHARLDGLEGLARQALVGGPQPPRQRRGQAHRELRAPRRLPAHVRPEDGERLERRRSSRPSHLRRSSSNIASSPKMSPRPEGGERDLAPVRVLAHGACVAGPDHVTRVGLVPLAEDDFTEHEPARVGASATRARSSGPSDANTGTRARSSAVGSVLPVTFLGGLPPAGRFLCHLERPLASPPGGGSAPRSAARTTIAATGSKTARTIISTPAITSSTRTAVTERVARRPAVAGGGGLAGGRRVPRIFEVDRLRS